MASFLLHNPLTKLVGNLLTLLNVAVQFILFMALFIATFGIRPSGRLGQILYQTVGEITPPYVDETIQPPLLLREAAATLIQISIIAFLMILSASLAMYYRRRNDKTNDEEQTKLLSAMGGDVKKFDESQLLPFRTLLLRNTLMTVLIVPLPVLLMYGMAFLMGGGLRTLPFFDTLRDHRFIVELILRLSIFGLFGLLIVWFGVAEKIVDVRLLKIARPRVKKGEFAELAELAGFPEDAEFLENLALADEATPKPSRIRRFASIMASNFTEIFNIMIWFAPIVVIMIVLGLVVELFDLTPLVFYLGTLLAVGIKSYRSVMRALEGPPDSPEARDNSPVARQLRYFLRFIFIYFGLVLAATVIAAEVTTAGGGTGDDRKNAVTAVLGGGTLLFVGGLFVLVWILPDDSPVTKATESATAAMLRGDYPEMLRVTEKLLEEVPIWESRRLGAIAYLAVRRFDEAERCINRVLQDIAWMRDDERKKLKSVAGIMRGLMATLRAAQGRYADAEAEIHMALTLDPDEPTHYNTLAEILMLQWRSADEVWAALDMAQTRYQKAKRQPSPTHHALRAWAWAMRGDSAQSEREMAQASALVRPEEQMYLVEAHLSFGRAKIALGDVAEARAALGRAATLDPNGLNGVMAAELLATLA